MNVRVCLGALGLATALAFADAAFLSALAATAPSLDPVRSERPSTSALLAAAAALDRSAKANTAPAALRELRLRTSTTAGGGVEYSPALDDWLHAGLGVAFAAKKPAARAADFRSLAATLRRIAALESLPQSEPHATLQATVTRVLAQPVYHPAATPGAKPQLSWWQLLLERIARWWASVIGGAVSAAIGIPAIGNVLATVLLGAATVALAFLAYRVAMLLVWRRSRRSGIEDAGSPVEMTPDADAMYEAACAAARAGSYAIAIALIFNAALVALDRAGRVPYDAARTAGEYRRAVRRNVVAAAASFETLARAFTFVAYAQTPAGEEEWRTAHDAYRTMPLTPAPLR